MGAPAWIGAGKWAPQAGTGGSKQIPPCHLYSSPKQRPRSIYRGAGERPPRQLAALPPPVRTPPPEAQTPTIFLPSSPGRIQPRTSSGLVEPGLHSELTVQPRSCSAPFRGRAPAAAPAPGAATAARNPQTSSSLGPLARPGASEGRGKGPREA